jgi:hypothetical protein
MQVLLLALYIRGSLALMRTVSLSCCTWVSMLEHQELLKQGWQRLRQRVITVLQRLPLVDKQPPGQQQHYCCHCRGVVVEVISCKTHTETTASSVVFYTSA